MKLNYRIKDCNRNFNKNLVLIDALTRVYLEF